MKAINTEAIEGFLVGEDEMTRFLIAKGWENTQSFYKPWQNPARGYHSMTTEEAFENEIDDQTRGEAQ